VIESPQEAAIFKVIPRRAAGTAAAAAAALTVLVSAAAPANVSGGFGQHVRACAQTTGLSGAGNPGMHQGFHAWDPSHPC
jgi:hypothetical protein